MTASEFVNAIKAITPNECVFSMMPEGFCSNLFGGVIHWE